MFGHSDIQWPFLKQKTHSSFRNLAVNFENSVLIIYWEIYKLWVNKILLLHDSFLDEDEDGGGCDDDGGSDGIWGTANIFVKIFNNKLLNNWQNYKLNLLDVSLNDCNVLVNMLVIEDLFIFGCELTGLTFKIIVLRIMFINIIYINYIKIKIIFIHLHFFIQYRTRNFMNFN